MRARPAGPLALPVSSRARRRVAAFAACLAFVLPRIAVGQTYAYVATAYADTVTVLDTRTNRVAKVIAGDGYPLAVAASRDGAFVYVANVDASTISVVDTQPNEIVATIRLPPYSFPNDLAVGADGARVYAISTGNRTPKVPGTLFVIDTATGAVADALALPEDLPVGIRISPDGMSAYVANAGADSISIIDTQTNTLRAKVALGRTPFALAFRPDGLFAYVANRESSTVSVVNTATQAVAATVPVGLGPRGIAVTPDGAVAYVANSSNSVYVVDTATNTLADAIFPVRAGQPDQPSSEPYAAAVTPDGSTVYVTNETSQSVSAIDAASNAVVDVIPVSGSPRGIAVASRLLPSPTRRLPSSTPTAIASPGTPSGAMQSRAYVANQASQTLSVINTANDTVVATIDIPQGAPTGLAFTPDGAFAYVAALDHVVVINAATNTLVTSIALPDAAPATAVAVTPDGLSAYVGSSARVFVIDTASNTIIATIPGGNILSAIAIAPDGTSAYVADSGGFPIIVTDTARNMVTTTVPVNAAQDVAISADGQSAYATSGNLYVISTVSNTVAANVPAGAAPGAIALAPDGGAAYVASSNDSVFVIDTRTGKITATIYPLPSPSDIAVTADGAFAYVTDFGTDAVSVVSLAARAVLRTISVGTRPVAIALASPPLTFCVGDCGGERTVTVDELVRGVRIALGDMPLVACPEFDANGDGRAVVNELVQGVGNALQGCPPAPATAIPTPTPTHTPAPGECAAVCDGRPCDGVCPDGSPHFGYCWSTGPDGCECQPFECPYPCVAVNPVTSPWDRLTQTITGYQVGPDFGARVTINGGAEPASGSVVSGTGFAIPIALNPGLNQLSVSSYRDYPPCSGTLRRDSQGGPLDILVVLPTPTPGA